jgi:gas vesicle protein
VTEGSRVFLSTLVGAIVGAAAGYLYFTDTGRRIRSQIEPKLDDAMHEIVRIRGTVSKVQAVATEGWRSLSQMSGEGAPQWGRYRGGQVS